MTARLEAFGLYPLVAGWFTWRTVTALTFAGIGLITTGYRMNKGDTR